MRCLQGEDSRSHAEEVGERSSIGDSEAGLSLAEKVEMFRREYPDLRKKFMGVAMGYFRNPADAEDAFADGILKAYSNIENYDGSCSLSTWVGRAVVWSCRDEKRRQKKRGRISQEIKLHKPDLNHVPPRPDEYAELSRLSERLDELIDDLGPQVKGALKLRMNGIEYIHIADKLDVPGNTAKSRIRYARKNLKGMLAKATDLQQYNPIRRLLGNNGYKLCLQP